MQKAIHHKTRGGAESQTQHSPEFCFSSLRLSKRLIRKPGQFSSWVLFWVLMYHEIQCNSTGSCRFWVKYFLLGKQSEGSHECVLDLCELGEMRAEPRLLGSEEATVAKKGCPLRGSAPRAHALCELGLSLPLCRAVWVAVRIREGHRRKATTVSCMSSSHCFRWRTCLLFNEKQMEESAPH